MDTENSFGQWIRKRRRALGLTQAELARQVRYSAAMLRKIENDERRPSPHAAELFAQALRIPPEQLADFLQVARQQGAGDQDETGPWLGDSRPQTNLPLPATRFVGREAELERLANLLGDATGRLITLVGLAGIGKTRLALQAAQRHLGRFEHGVFFVPLAPLASPAMLVGTVAQAIGFQFHGTAEPEQQLLQYLREKRLLLVLDNFEHLLDGARLLAAILEAAPGIQLLVTSRERLNLQGEWVLELDGLPFPVEPDAGSRQRAETYAAVELFVQSAVRVNPSFRLHDENWNCVVRLCQLMQGMPLGLELAAAWVRALSCQEISRQIEHNLDFLKTSARDVPERHRSLRSALDHSWNLLSPQEQAVFRRLSVFRGGFGAEAAQAVAGASLEDITSLLDKSLLRRVGEARYDLHELVRQYAAAHLEADGQEFNQTHDRHSDYYAARLEHWDIRAQGPGLLDAIAEMDVEIDNIRLAWEWMVVRQQTTNIRRSLRSLWRFHELRGRFREHTDQMARAVAALQVSERPRSGAGAEHLAVLALVLAQQGYFYSRLDRYEEAEACLQRSVTLARATADRTALLEPLYCLGYMHFRLGNHTTAAVYTEEFLALTRELGRQWEMVYALILLSSICAAQGAFEQAYSLAQEGLTISREILGDPHGTEDCLIALSTAASHLGRYTEAKRWAEEGLEISQMLHDRWGIGQTLRRLGLIHLALRETSDAEAMLRQSIIQLREVGDRTLVATALIDLGRVHHASGAVQRTKACWLEALQMALETQTMGIALQALAEIAGMYMNDGASEQALEVVLHCLQHAAAHPEVNDRAQQLEADLIAQLSPQQLEAAQRRTQTTSLESLARAIVAGG